jgi:hypothetical protein
MRQLLATFVFLYPSLWEALTHLAVLPSNPELLAGPPTIEGPIGDMSHVSLVGVAGVMCEE